MPCGWLLSGVWVCVHSINYVLGNLDRLQELVHVAILNPKRISMNPQSTIITRYFPIQA